MSNEISPAKKAATLVVTLGPEKAREILRHLSDDEFKALTSEVASLGQVEESDHLAVLRETVDSAGHHLRHAVGGPDEARQLKTLRRGLGVGGASRPFGFVDQIEEQQLIQFLKAEHPQIAALVLANQPAEFSAGILNEMTSSLRSEVAYRIATLGRASTAAVAKVEAALRDLVDDRADQFEEEDEDAGAKGLAAILNSSDKETEHAVLEHLAVLDEALAEQVKNLMFVFEDIVILDDRSIQEVLKNVDMKSLAIALKGAQPEIENAITRNLSERARETLSEELDLLGPVRRAEVEAAGKEIVAVIRTLESDGQIVINRSEGDLIE